MNTEKRQSVPAAAYALGGAVVGATLALLFAPKKGSELREDIGEFGRTANRKGHELYARAKDMIPDRAKAVKLVGVAKGASRDALHDVKEKINAALHS